LEPGDRIVGAAGLLAVVATKRYNKNHCIENLL
jgi:hypothetical protein